MANTACDHVQHLMAERFTGEVYSPTDAGRQSRPDSASLAQPPTAQEGEASARSGPCYLFSFVLAFDLALSQENGSGAMLDGFRSPAFASKLLPGRSV